jgi:hypothetical protein
LKKNAVIGFINNFGQTPKQLFKKPHPSKKVGGTGSRISGLEMGCRRHQDFIRVDLVEVEWPPRLFFIPSIT